MNLHYGLNIQTNNYNTEAEITWGPRQKIRLLVNDQRVIIRNQIWSNNEIVNQYPNYYSRALFTMIVK